MKFRSALLALAGVTALLFAGSAFASFSPKLTVDPLTTSFAQTFELSLGASDNPTAAATIFAAPFSLPVLVQPVGDQIGTVDANVIAADLGGANIPLPGTVVVANTADYKGNPCAADGTYSVVWLLKLTAPTGTELDVPMYVAKTTPASPLFLLGSLVLKTCLPPPDVPVGTPGRATFGAKLVRAKITLNGVFATESSITTAWTTAVTPYIPLMGKPNPAGTVEAQGLVASGDIEVTAKKVAGGKVKVSGQVTQGGEPAAGVSVDIGTYNKAGKKTKSLGTARTNASGNFSKTVKGKTSSRFGAHAKVAGQDLPGAACDPPLPLGTGLMPCSSVTMSGFDTTGFSK